MMRDKESFDYLFKIVLVGNTAVGKTNLLSKLTRNEFSIDSKATIGVEFGTLSVEMEKNVIKAQIWDTAGQERYQAIVQSYYRGSTGAAIVYDVTDKNSLRNATTSWLFQLRDFSPRDIPIVLIGNKMDLEENREVSREDGENEALSNNLSFFETSALTGENVREAFLELIKIIYSKEKTKGSTTERRKTEVVKLKDKNLRKVEPKSKSSCC